MAKLQIRTDANAIIYSKDIPDAIITYAQEVFGGSTNQETAQHIVEFMWAYLKPHVRNRVTDAAGREQEPLVYAARAAKEAEFDAAVGA